MIARAQNSNLDDESTLFNDSFCLYRPEMHILAIGSGKEDGYRESGWRTYFESKH